MVTGCTTIYDAISHSPDTPFGNCNYCNNHAPFSTNMFSSSNKSDSKSGYSVKNVPFLTDENCHFVSVQTCTRNILEARKKVDLTIPELLRFIINQCTKSRQRPTRCTD